MRLGGFGTLLSGSGAIVLTLRLPRAVRSCDDLGVVLRDRCVLCRSVRDSGEVSQRLEFEREESGLWFWLYTS
jgi:hypothetical protein